MTATPKVGTRSGTVSVMWEGRKLTMPAAGFTDKFGAYETHIYELS